MNIKGFAEFNSIINESQDANQRLKDDFENMVDDCSDLIASDLKYSESSSELDDIKSKLEKKYPEYHKIEIESTPTAKGNDNYFCIWMRASLSEKDAEDGNYVYHEVNIDEPSDNDMEPPQGY